MVREMIKGFIKRKKKSYIVGFVLLIISAVCVASMPVLIGHIIDGMTPIYDPPNFQYYEVFNYETNEYDKIYNEIFQNEMGEYFIICGTYGTYIVIPETWAPQRRLTLNQVFMFGGLVLGLGALIFVFKYSFRSLIMGNSRNLECYLREELFTHLQLMPPKFYNEKKTGDLMSYVINDLNAIRMAFSMGLTFFTDGVVVSIASIIIMATQINVYLTIIAVVPMVVSLFVTLKLRKVVRKRFTAVQDAFADLSEKIQENITGIRVVKSYVQEKPEIEKLSKASMRRFKVQMDYVKVSALLWPVVQISFAASFAVIIVIGGQSAASSAAGTMTIGNFISLNLFLMMLIMPMNQLSRTIEVWQRAFASMRRLEGIFIEKTDITDVKADFSITEIQGKIEFRDLTFAYPSAAYPNKNKNVLENISFTVEKGKTLGIIGATGSGKTTLINILMRLYPIEDGKVFIDDNDINHIPLKVVRSGIGCVPQDNFLFATSITQNVKFFDELIRNESVIDASKLSCVYENILDFPEQFETLIGERGITLSGGQKQRISIARAVVKDPDVLILDDSLSAVDTNTEEKILANVKTVLEGKTGILIAHRVSTIKHADDIIVLNDSKIVERGTHEYLLELGGEYARLNRIQTLEKELTDDVEVGE